MKLYTEEQVLRGIVLARLHEYSHSREELLGLLTPIELPSDDEVKKMMELDGMEFDEFDPYDVSYLGGATWMRNKILSNEQTKMD
jgi:hypothetical protein